MKPNPMHFASNFVSKTPSPHTKTLKGVALMSSLEFPLPLEMEMSQEEEEEEEEEEEGGGGELGYKLCSVIYMTPRPREKDEEKLCE